MAVCNSFLYMALTYSFAAGRLVLVSRAFLSVECSTEDGSEKKNPETNKDKQWKLFRFKSWRDENFKWVRGKDEIVVTTLSAKESLETFVCSVAVI